MHRRNAPSQRGNLGLLAKTAGKRKADKSADKRKATVETTTETTDKRRRRRETIDSDEEEDEEFLPDSGLAGDSDGDDDGEGEGEGEDGEVEVEEGDGDVEGEGEGEEGAPSPSIKEILAGVARGLKSMVSALGDTNTFMRRLAPAAHNAPANGPGRANAPAHVAAAAAAAAAAPTSLPLDGTTRGLYGGWRSIVVKAIAPVLFKFIGQRWTTMPFSTAMPLAMVACNLDPTDPQQRSEFTFHYKSETSKVGSKTKQQLADFFVDQLLTLYQAAVIQDAGSPNPPNLVDHEVSMPALKNPPPGFDATEPRYKMAMAWHASLDANNALMMFATPQCRKLLEADFFSRCAAKGLLPGSAHKWNLGALAWFLVFTYARLTIVRRANGTKTYGTLRDEGVITEVERVCEWLMDPVLCPTTWPVLLKIRGENPTYGANSMPVVA